MAEKIKLIASQFSPYCFRVEMALIEKGLQYEKLLVDLSNRPDWFVADAPLGKVPFIYVQEKTLFESMAICEYIEEISANNSLHSQDVLIRNQHRAWMEFSSSLIASTFAMVFVKNAAELENKKLEIIAKIQILDKNLAHKNYFNGEKFLLVDIFMASLFAPLCYINNKFSLNLFANCSNVLSYSENLLARDSLKQSLPNNYPDLFTNFLVKRNSYLLENN